GRARIRHARRASDSRRASRSPIESPCEALPRRSSRAVSFAAIQTGIRRLLIVFKRRRAQRLPEARAARGSFLLQWTLIRPPAHRLDPEIPREDRGAPPPHPAR